MPGKGVAAIATMTRLDRAGTYPSFAQRKSDCIPSRHCNATIGYRPPTVLKWNEDDEPLPLDFPVNISVTYYLPFGATVAHRSPDWRRVT